ncbi:MAG: asparagine synthase (glutamine-hydrolyzing) [Candidatus Schekmanbacteria bacterium]|nr:asparagine synthase (glutamine-hydrolyzing) [Candidatus Schekmanbacteria bacterium]
MCGIVGRINFDGRPASAGELEAMAATLSHRGPDHRGFRVAGNVALGMCRLSIIDLCTGEQPIANEDGTIWVVFNGEIYNFKELRRELEARGHVFRTGTDTECIVHLYEDYGEDCVQELRGMFAFALWDERRRHLLLARDRLGIKPLFWARVNDSVVFASELKAMLQVREVGRELNWAAVRHLFTFLTTPRQESIIAGVHKLEAGHLLAADPDREPAARSYWDVDFQPRPGRRLDDYVAELRALLEESVRLHLVSDVPLGAFLSGGVDSSAVVATMARLGGEPVRTFSIGFPEADYNELAAARAVAQQFQTIHTELVLEPDVLDIVENLAWYLDEPFGDTSAIPTYMVSKLASEHVTVALSGDGGDELFAGYDKYAVEAREREWDRRPEARRKVFGWLAAVVPEGVRGHNYLHHKSLRGAQRYLDAGTLFRAESLRRLFRPELWSELLGTDPRTPALESLGRVPGSWLSALQYLDLKNYLPLDILTKVDRMSMACSIEARVPLLDHKIVELAAAIPPELQVAGGVRKHVFKEALRGILPDAILDRPKSGFAIPLGRWFRGELGGFVRELLLSPSCLGRGWFDRRYVETLIARHQRGRELDLHLWTMMSFELWCRAFLDGAAVGAHGEATRLQRAGCGVENGDGRAA